MPCLLEAIAKRGCVKMIQLWRSGIQKADNWGCALLRARNDRPSCSRTSDQFYEVAPPHRRLDAQCDAWYPVSTFIYRGDCEPSNVCFGSKADMCTAPAHVRFTPNS